MMKMKHNKLSVIISNLLMLALLFNVTGAMSTAAYAAEGDFIPVLNITDVPTTATAGTPLSLTGTVLPANATNKDIKWSVKDAGSTGAAISGSILNTMSAGTVVVKATIADAIFSPDDLFIAIAAGEYHTIGLKADGSLWAWGDNSYGRLGVGDTANRTAPTRVGSDTDWAAISAGRYHTIGLKKDGSIWAWGRNNSGQIGVGDTINKTSPELVGSSNWVAISAGDSHTLGLKTDGSLWAWGYNNYGQLGVGGTTERTAPIQVGSDKDWVAISAGGSHTLGLKANGSLWAWGRNNYGQLGVGDTTNRISPILVGGDIDWKVISAGSSHTMGLKTDGSLFAWGNNAYGQLGVGDTINKTAPRPVGSDTAWVVISTGTSHTIGLKADGSLWAWGLNNSGQLGVEDTTNRTAPTLVGSDTDWAAISTGTSHTIGLKADGSLWAWGDNVSGQLGVGDTSNRTAPTKVGSDIDWVAISAGFSHTVGLKADGSLWAWGDNAYGQLGVGDTTDRYSPTKVGSDTDWAAVLAGYHHTLGLKTDGRLFSWGNNAYGQLGVDDTTNRTAPTKVGSDTDWSTISAGYNHTLGLKTDGRLFSWGNNAYGQLGVGDTSNRTAPTQVGSDTDWSAISAGYNHTLGLKTDGRLFSWGNNDYGQLGVDDTMDRYSPTQVGSNTDWTAISAGYNHTLGLKTNRCLFVWGRNNSSQLGVDDTMDRYSPTQVGSDTDWSAISAGYNHTLGLKTNRCLFAWGRDNSGELGLAYTSPTTILFSYTIVSYTKDFIITVYQPPVQTYSVTYNLNGGTGTVPAETDKATGAAFAAASIGGITAPFGRQFKEWNTTQNGMGTAYAPGASVVMPGNNLTLYAIWTDIPAVTTYAVTVSSEGAGATGGGNYAAGATVSISAGTPPDGMRFVNWTASPAVIFADENSASTMFTMPANAVTATANFEPIPVTTYEVTVSSAGTGATGGGDYAAGATVSINAGTPLPGYVFLNWTASPAVTFANSNSVSTTFEMAANDVTVTANFQLADASILFTGMSLEFQIGLALDESTWVYTPGFPRTEEMEFMVPGGKGPFMLWLGIEDVYPPVFLVGFEADGIYEISDSFYEIEVPEEVSGVGISFYEDVWYVEDFGEGDVIPLLKTSAEAVLVYEHGGVRYEKTFVPDGSGIDPFDVSLPVVPPVEVIPSVSTEPLAGNKENLTISFTETFPDGSVRKGTTTITINENTAGYYTVGLYVVYVDAKGRDQIRRCYIVK